MHERIFINFLSKPSPEHIEYIKSAAGDCVRGLLHQGRIRVYLQNLRSFALENKRRRRFPFIPLRTFMPWTERLGQTVPMRFQASRAAIL
jgi:hypothetical protein